MYSADSTRDVITTVNGKELLSGSAIGRPDLVIDFFSYLTSVKNFPGISTSKLFLLPPTTLPQSGSQDRSPPTLEVGSLPADYQLRDRVSPRLPLS